MGGASGWGQNQQHLEDLFVMAAEGKLTRYQLSSPLPGAPVGSPELLGTPTQSAASPRYNKAHLSRKVSDMKAACYAGIFRTLA